MNPDKVTEFLTTLESRLGKLPYPNQLAFVASCCETAYPNYERFSQVEHWGNRAVLRSALDEVWEFLLGADAEPGCWALMVEGIKAATPDSDMFHPKSAAESVLITAGQEAAFMVTLLLEFCRDHDLRHVMAIADFSQETVRRYVQAVDGMDPNDPGLEQKIALHPLMLREFERENRDLEALTNVITSSDLREFRHRAIPEFSNISIQNNRRGPLQP